MITTEGKSYIKRYLAGLVPSLAESIAIGTGSTAPTLTDARLQFEIERAGILLTSYDFIGDQLIFKADATSTYGGTINEIGLFSLMDNTVAGDFASRLILTFDSDEYWVDSTTGAVETAYTSGSTNVKVSTESLTHTPAANATKVSSLGELALDFSGNSNVDLFSFAYYVGNANTGGLRFRFLTDSSNYYEFSLGAQTTGYKVNQVTKSTAIVTGTPSWDDITEIQARTTASASGSASVLFDGFRVEDVDSINPDYVLIARTVLATPIILDSAKSQDIEYALGVNI